MARKQRSSLAETFKKDMEVYRSEQERRKSLPVEARLLEAYAELNEQAGALTCKVTENSADDALLEVFCSNERILAVRGAPDELEFGARSNMQLVYSLLSESILDIGKPVRAPEYRSSKFCILKELKSRPDQTQ